MKHEIVNQLTATFEGHAQKTENGIEYWLGRDLQFLLGCQRWENFTGVLNRAKTACDISDQNIEDHFRKGDKALFGKSTLAMKAAWNVPDTRPLADFAPTITDGWP